MKYSHFYTVDQWELRDMEGIYNHTDDKQMWHNPCEHVVVKATTGVRWVCAGCYTEPPEEIMDVIFLSDAYKGWKDPEPYTNSSWGGNFYFSPASMGRTITISTDTFYCDWLDSGSTFYIGGSGALTNGTNWSFGGMTDIVSQHISDLKTKVSNSLFKQIAADLGGDPNDLKDDYAWEDEDY